MFASPNLHGMDNASTAKRLSSLYREQNVSTLVLNLHSPHLGDLDEYFWIYRPLPGHFLDPAQTVGYSTEGPTYV